MKIPRSEVEQIALDSMWHLEAERLQQLRGSRLLLGNELDVSRGIDNPNPVCDLQGSQMFLIFLTRERWGNKEGT